MPSRMLPRKLRVCLAAETDRQMIYGMRHQIYACEIGQHPENPEGQLRDSLDCDNVYIVAKAEDSIAGFVSVTPPRIGRFSIDKYLSRDQIPFCVDSATYEIRILTVMPAHRGTAAALLLMYAAFRWVEAHGGTRIMALGRHQVRNLYLQAGLRDFDVDVRSGSVDFALMSETVEAIRSHLTRFDDLLVRLEEAAAWELVVPFRRPASCFHGGAFFAAIGEEFERLDRASSVINADVLDAWFPPSPRVISALQEYLPWLLRTSPPVCAEGLTRSIGRARGVDAACVLPGAGSSDLIFLALRQWLTPSSRVLLPEPTYGEYAHVLDRIVRCRVDRLVLSREKSYDLDLSRLLEAARQGYDLIVLVNPNSPTGRHVRRAEMEALLTAVPDRTMVWIDETYIDYVGREESVERFAVARDNVVVCKSMSKVYALSGVRCAYLCCSPHLLEQLRSITPPWAVSLPAQVAAIAALRDDEYYRERYRQTHELRRHLAAGLHTIAEIEQIVEGSANFLLCHLVSNGADAAAVVSRCREQALYLRDTSTLGESLGRHAFRIAVKDRQATDRCIDILRSACSSSSFAGSDSMMSGRAAS